jgi:hypothetical protein
MVAVEFNWDQAAPGPWGSAVAASVRSLPAHKRTALPAVPLSRVSLDPASLTITAVGQMIDVDILVENVTNLYGGRIEIGYDPGFLQVVGGDTRSSAAAGQFGPGDFLDATHQYVLLDRADNNVGRAEFAVTQLRPAAARTGGGVLTTLQFETVSLGTTSLWLGGVELLDNSQPAPVEIPVEIGGREGTID